MRRVGSKTTEFEGIYHLKSRLLRGFPSIFEVIQASKKRRGSFEGRGEERFNGFRGKSIAPPGVLVPALFTSVLRKSGGVKAKEHTLTPPLFRKKVLSGAGGGWRGSGRNSRTSAALSRRSAATARGIFRSKEAPGGKERRAVTSNNEDMPSQQREYPRKSLIYFPRIQRVFTFSPATLRKSKGLTAYDEKKHPPPRPDRRGGVSLSGDKSNKRRSKNLRQD